MKLHKALNPPVLTTIIIGFLLLVSICSCNDGNSKSSNNNNQEIYSTDNTLGSKAAIAEILTNSNHEQFFVIDSIQKFYSERDFAPVWSDPALRKKFLEILRNAEAEGLYFKDYHGEELEAKESNLKVISMEDKSNLDILFTDAFFKFSMHLLNGKTDPHKIHEIFDLPKNRADLISLLKESISSGELEPAFNKVRPSNPIYKQLITALEVYREKKDVAEEFKSIEEGELIKPNMQDPRLPKIKFRLMVLGYLKDVDPFSYDHSQQVQDAVKQLQLENGLLADAIIGNSTIKLLNINYADRYDQILANLERWRWYPRVLGDHYILVNIANYHLEVLTNDKVVSDHKTMVGTDVRKTPIFSDEIEYIVFNPNWTIPPTIKIKDVIPGAKNSIDYLQRKNIDVYNTNGDLMDPSEIDWDSNKVKSYIFRQSPGSSNPLGKVKIIYPNKHMIYLHDTPSQSLFARNSRAQSSGCIRVENALDLAKYLLSDQPKYSSEKIDEIVEKGKLKEVKVNQKVKVYHLYWTAWMENDKPRFTEDIYNYDEKIIEELKSVSTL